MTLISIILEYGATCDHLEPNVVCGVSNMDL